MNSTRGFTAFLVVLAVLVQASIAAGQEPTPETPPQRILKSLEQHITNTAPRFPHENFAIVVGIDSSASFADSNRLAYARAAVTDFLQKYLVPGDQVAVFHFGPEPFPLWQQAFQAIPSGTSQEAIEARNRICSDIDRLVQRNPQTGTDTLYAYYFALFRARSCAMPNRMVLLLTDTYNEKSQWAKSQERQHDLDQTVREFAGKESTLQLSDGVYLKSNIASAGGPLLTLPEGTDESVEDRRQSIVRWLLSSPPPPSPVPGPESMPIIPLVFAAAVAAVICFALSRPIPVTLVGDGERTEYVSLNRALTIGGAEQAAGISASASPQSPIARLQHVFPRRLLLSRLKGAIQCRIQLEDGSEVDDAPVSLNGEAEIQWVNPSTGRAHSLQILKGRPTAEPVDKAEEEASS